MRLVSVELKPQPMVYVSAHSSMAEIQGVMGTAFGRLGDFLGAAHVAPQGPPFAIYHDWSEGKTMVDIGFPVSAADSNKAMGEIHAGMTPAGFALKTLHQGSYAGLPTPTRRSTRR